MTLLKITMGFGLAALIVCVGTMIKDSHHPAVPPAGYRILCDRRGHYVVESVGLGLIGREVYRSKREAIGRAWHDYEQDMLPDDIAIEFQKKQAELRSRFTECNEPEKDKP